jgi:hypothetical protein
VYDTDNDVYYLEDTEAEQEQRKLKDALLEVQNHLTKQGKFTPKIKLGGEK